MKQITSVLCVFFACAMMQLQGCRDEIAKWEQFLEEQEDSWGQQDSWERQDSEGRFPLGTAGELQGKTLIVSVFADDRFTSWSEQDTDCRYRTMEYVSVATDWLSEQAASYGVDATFQYNWTYDSDLCYSMKVDTDLTECNDDDIDYFSWRAIEHHIDSDALLEKYNADNIIYLMLVNTPDNNQITSCTRCWYEGMRYPYEVCYIYVNYDGEEEPPAVYAHEILHTFGAPDLYTPDLDGYNYGISRQYVKKLEKEHSNDIMFTTYEDNWQSVYDCITNELTELDAYYLGLTEYSQVAEEWGFQKSQHTGR